MASLNAHFLWAESENLLFSLFVRTPFCKVLCFLIGESFLLFIGEQTLVNARHTQTWDSHE